MNLLTLRERSYIAGIMDDEGSITIHPRIPKPTNKLTRSYYRPVIIISNTNKALLEHIQRMCGTGWVGITNHAKGERNTGYHFQLGKKEEIRYFLQQILDCLYLKKDQALLMLEFIESRLHTLELRKPTRYKPIGYSRRQLEIIDLLHDKHMRTKTAHRVVTKIFSTVNALPPIG